MEIKGIYTQDEVESAIKQNPQTIDYFADRGELRKLQDLDWDVKAKFIGESEARISEKPGASDAHKILENPGDYERNAEITMTSSGGLELKFDVQTNASSSDANYEETETLRDFYESAVIEHNQGSGRFEINGHARDPGYTDSLLINELKSKWEGPAKEAMPPQVPGQLERYADKSRYELHQEAENRYSWVKTEDGQPFDPEAAKALARGQAREVDQVSMRVEREAEQSRGFGR